jgi:hypothetical protein
MSAIPAENLTATLEAARAGRKEAASLSETQGNLAPGTYREFDYPLAQNSLDRIYFTVRNSRAWSAEELDTLDSAHLDTARFLRTTFNIYEGRVSLEHVFRDLSLEEVKYAFVVPARGEYATEAQQVLPITQYLKPGEVDEHKHLFKELLGNLPPFVLATYQQTGLTNKPIGLCIYSPQDLETLERSFQGIQSNGNVETAKEFKDITRAWKEKDLPKLASTIMTVAGKLLTSEGRASLHKLHTAGKSLSSAVKDGRASVNEALAFAKRIAPGIQHAGLGAVLPGLTDLGKSIKAEAIGVEPTTGHRTTIWAMHQTLETIIASDETNGKNEVTVGVIGAGYIGSSAADMYLSSGANRKIIVYDVRAEIGQKTVDILNKKYPGRASLAKDTAEVFTTTPYIFSAATGKIDLPVTMDFSGTVIIDDSEPSSVEPEQLYKRGGVMVKPVIETQPSMVFEKGNQVLDPNRQIAVTRKGLNYASRSQQPYDYGWIKSNTNGAIEPHFGPGLIDETTFFGCEAEAAIATIIQRKIFAHYVATGDTIPTRNPVLFAKQRVNSEAMAELTQIEGVGELLAGTINIDMLQGGGVKIGGKILEGREIRRKKTIKDYQSPPKA